MSCGLAFGVPSSFVLSALSDSLYSPGYSQSKSTKSIFVYLINFITFSTNLALVEAFAAIVEKSPDLDHPPKDTPIFKLGFSALNTWNAFKIPPLTSP